MFVVASMISFAATPHRVAAQDSGFVAWPRELASRAPALADDITREFGQRPSTIAFAGRDTIRIVFWNPRIWQGDMVSKVFPQQSLPLVREAMTNVGAYVWKAIGRDAGVNLIGVEFVRVVHDERYARPNHEARAQVVRGLMTRQMLETGQAAAVTVAQGEAGAWDESTQKRLDSLRFGPEHGRATRAALVAAIQRAIGQPAVYVTMKGMDTIDVEVWNPTFWRQDDTVKAFPDATLPTVRQATTRVVQTVWDQHGRDNGVKLIRVAFRREWRQLVNGMMLQRPAQDVMAVYARWQLEAGKLDSVRLTIAQR